ncbi:MAG TPA: ATP-grasp domain-containing protein, partial [Solirubrobacterales bacterium]|nr:ATP-grasp domain-containing protein [Solirubrobacterales bacterium]
KPSRGGSALGVKFAASRLEVPEALISAFSYDDRVLLERFVEGRELAVSVLGDEPLPVVEATPAGGDRYDFEARYEIGRTTFTCPAGLTDAETAAVTEAALGAYRVLGCAGFARADLILGEDGPRVLEVNAIPGLTDTSLLPQAAEAAGMSFEQLVERILDLALKPANA